MLLRSDPWMGYSGWGHTTGLSDGAARPGVCRPGKGSWSGPGVGGPCSYRSCEVCLHTLETHWSGLLGATVMAQGGPSDRPVGGGVSAASAGSLLRTVRQWMQCTEGPQVHLRLLASGWL